MLQTSSERAAAGAGMWVPGMSPQAAARLWVPGMTPTTQAAETGALGSARAREIAQRREEMLGMLHGLPEAEYELSLTDLVEKTGGVAPAPTKEAAPRPLGPPPTETKEATPSPSPLGPAAEQHQPVPAPRTERKGSARRGFRSSSDGVLLNFYMPAPSPAASPRRAPPARSPSSALPPAPSSSPTTATRGRETGHRQVLAVAVGSAVAEVEPARPDIATNRRIRCSRSGKALCFPS